MTEMLNAKEMQLLLDVDRSTIYRTATGDQGWQTVALSPGSGRPMAWKSGQFT